MRSTTMCMVLCALATAASAHHSGAMFDQAKTITLAGTVKEYQFTNPHVWIALMVPDARGKPVPWRIEGDGPQIMARIGLKPKALQAGEKVTLKAHPLRDGRPGGSFIALTLADGRVVGMPPRNAGAAAATAPAAK